MSYGDFTVRKVVDVLGYQVEERPFLDALGFVPEPPSDALLAAIGLLKVMVLHSELSRDVSLVGPVLAEAATKSHTRLFAGEVLDVDDKAGLTGVVDFILAAGSLPGATIVRPILCLVEAKRAEIDTRALGQCIASMIAAQRTNGDDEPVYGCVTTGADWQFIRLKGKLAEVEPKPRFENELPAVLGILLAFLRRTVPRSPVSG